MFLSTHRQNFTVSQTATEKSNANRIHFQQCLLPNPRSESKRSILVPPLQTKMGIPESFARTMICNTRAYRMLCESILVKRGVYTRLCLSPFFCQTWQRLFETLLAPSLCNANAIDFKSNCQYPIHKFKTNSQTPYLLFFLFFTHAVPSEKRLVTSRYAATWFRRYLEYAILNFPGPKTKLRREKY